MGKQFHLDQEQLERLYPFYLSIDKDLKITAFSEQLNKVAKLSKDVTLTDIFDVKPAGLLDAPFHTLAGRIFQFIKAKDEGSQSTFVIQGELLYLKEEGELLALGTPNIYFYKDNPRHNASQDTMSSIIRSTDADDKIRPDAAENTHEDHVVETLANQIAGVAITTANGAIEWVSKDFELTTGCTLNEIKGMRPRDVLYGKDSTYIPSSFVDEMVKKKATFSFENIGYNKSGGTFWFKTTVQPIVDSNDEITGRYYIFEDITNRKIKDDLYRHSYDLWRFAITASGDGVWAYDAETGKITTSERVKELLGLDSADEINAETAQHLLHPQDAPTFRNVAENTIRNNNLFINFDVRLKHKQLGHRYYRLRGKRMTMVTDRRNIYFGTITDVHAEKEKDMQLQNTASRLEALLKNINFGILLETEDRRVSLINDELRAIFTIPISDDELYGIDCSGMALGMNPLFKGDRLFSDRIDEILANKRPVIDELLYTTDNRVLERDYIPIFVNGIYNGHLWRYKDVTKRVTLEKRVVASEMRLTVLMNHLRQAVVFEDRDRNVIYINDVLVGIIGTMPEPTEGEAAKSTDVLKSIRHLFANPDKELEKIERIVADKEELKDDIVSLSDGRILSRQFIPLIIDTEESGYLWVYEDITERLNARQELIDQKEYYHRILNEIPADIVILTSENKFSFVNKSAIRDAEMRDWIIGRSMHDYCIKKGIDINFAKERDQLFKLVWASGKAQSVVDHYHAGTEQEKYILRVLYPFISPDRTLEFIVAYGIDITEEKKNERRAEEQEKNIRQLLDFTADGIFTCDKDLYITFCNPSFKRITGDTLAGGRMPNFLKYLPASEHHKVHNLIRLVEEGNSAAEPEAEYVRLTAGNKEEVYVDISFMKAGTAEPFTYIGKITDITERLTKEKNLTEIIDRERELSHTKTQFIRITSHELRTPLAIIQANTELLQMSLKPDIAITLSSRHQNMLGRIVKEVGHMTELLNQLMFVSRIETGKMEFSPTDCDIKQLLTEIAQDMFQPNGDGRYLKTELPADTIVTNADGRLLRHAVVNLVNNAFKYSAIVPDSPVLRLFTQADNIIIEVEDYGIGIPDEDKNKLFSSFFRASNTGNVSGSGLGLTIVEYVIGLHKGKIEFFSQLNKGTTFRIILNRNNNENNINS